MITNDGKQIIAKFLIGQAPEYATHIAAGCGAIPLFPNQTVSSETVEELKEKKSLEFESFRVPISSRGFVKEGGVEKIVIKAQMPTDQRYEISEVGFFPAAANTIAGNFDSKSLSIFTPTETWVIYSQESSSTILEVTEDTILSDASANIIVDDLAFFLRSDSTIFDNENRRLRREGTRYYTNALAVSGSSSFIDKTGSIFIPSESSYRIENSDISFNFSQNLPTDQIKMVFSVISKLSNNDTPPDKVRIILDFVNNIPGLDIQSPKARLGIEIDSAEFTVLNTGQSPDPQNRYISVTKNISDLVVDDVFSFANINLLRMYACTLDSGGNSTNDYFVALDGLRIENISSENPLYNMVGYNIIRNDFALPILKAQNTNNFIEYRFGIGVDI